MYKKKELVTLIAAFLSVLSLLVCGKKQDTPVNTEVEDSTKVVGEELKVVTEEWAPYNFTINGEVKGLGTEIVSELLKETGTSSQIKSYPWDRAYKMATTMPNVIIFTMSRNDEREKQFKWIGKIAPREISIFKLKKRKDISAKTLEDLKKYKIGVTSSEDSTTKYLISKGFEVGKNLDMVQSEGAEKLNITKFYSNRFDLLPINELSLTYQVKEMGLNIDDVEKIMVLTGQDDPGYYAAFSIDTPDETVKKFTDAYKKIVNDGRYKKIYDSYTK